MVCTVQLLDRKLPFRKMGISKTSHPPIHPPSSGSHSPIRQPSHPPTHLPCHKSPLPLPACARPPRVGTRLLHLLHHHAGQLAGGEVLQRHPQVGHGAAGTRHRPLLAPAHGVEARILDQQAGVKANTLVELSHLKAGRRRRGMEGTGGERSWKQWR